MVQGPKKGEKKPGKNIGTNSTTVRLIVVVVFMIGISGALYMWTNSYYQAREQAAKEAEKAELQVVAKGTAENISKSLQTINSRLETLVKSKKLLSLLEKSDQAMLDSNIGEFSNGFPSLLKLRIYLPGNYKLDRDSTPPVSYASLDLLKRAERSNDRINAEVHGINSPDAYIVIVRRLMNDQNKLAGLLHLSLSADLLKNSFESYDGGANTYLELVQVSGSLDNKLYAKGSEGIKRGNPVSSDINGTSWQIRVWGKGGMTSPATGTADILPLPVSQLVVVVLVILILAGWYLFRSRKTGDVEEETVYGGSVKAIMEGEHPGLEKLVPDLPDLGQSKQIKPASRGMEGEDITTMNKPTGKNAVPGNTDVKKAKPHAVKDKEKTDTEAKIKPEMADKLKEISEIKAKIQAAKKAEATAGDETKIKEEHKNNDTSIDEISLDEYLTDETPGQQDKVDATDDDMSLTFSLDEETEDVKPQDSDTPAGEISLDEYLVDETPGQQDKTDATDDDMSLSFSLDEETEDAKPQDSDAPAGEISLEELQTDETPVQQDKTDATEDDMSLSFSLEEEAIEDEQQDSGTPAGEISLEELQTDQVTVQQDEAEAVEDDMTLSFSLDEEATENKKQDSLESEGEIKIEDNSLDFDLHPDQSEQKISAEIFRAYDIRGIVGSTLTTEGIYEIGRATASEAQSRGQTEIVVGRDGRTSSQELANSLIKGLRDAGCNVIDIGMLPTPVLYFATHHLSANSGVMITGSHNGPEYNGLKIVLNNETLSGEAIMSLYRRIIRKDLSIGQGDLQSTEIIPEYIKIITDDIPVALGNSFKIVIDCGNGVAGEVAPQLFRALGHDVIELFCDVDGNFPNHHPDPSQPENLQDLIEKVRREKADIGLAFDGDGDRLGVVDSEGNIIWPDRQMILFARDVLTRNEGSSIIFDVKCSRYLKEAIEECGGRALMWKTGHSLIKSKMKEEEAPLGGEMSGHIFFKERWYGFDDAIYAGARLIEILLQNKESPVEVFARLPGGVSTPEIRIPLEEKYHQEFMQNLGKNMAFENATITDIDGIRADFTDGWGLVRASNTSPCLTARFEAKDKGALDRITSEFRTLINTVSPNLKVPF